MKNNQWYMNAMAEEPEKHISEPTRHHKYFKNLKIDAIPNARFDFGDDNAKLVPIIFSHGLNASGATYSKHCIELASHGYIVFAIWHKCGSCQYTEDINGSIPFDTKHRFYDYDVRKTQLNKRVEEISLLIDEIFGEHFLHDTFGFPSGVELDKEKLAVSGHSFGAMTSIAVAREDKRVKVCMPMDPWFFPVMYDL